MVKMSNRKPIIEIKNLGVRYDDVVALEHVNLTIYDNDFIGVSLAKKIGFFL